MDYDPRNLLISSDYPLDKVIYLGSHQVTLGSFDIQEFSMPHGLGFTPLMMGQWSNSSDFSVAYSIYGGASVGANRAWETLIESDSTNIYIRTQNRTNSTGTAYYRMFGLVPSNENPIAAPTAIEGDDFIINTSYNYMKLSSSGTTTLAEGASTTISHELGFNPKVMIWNTLGTRTRMKGASFVDVPIELFARTTSSELFIHNKGGFGTTTVHYRIYADEA